MFVYSMIEMKIQILILSLRQSFIISQSGMQKMAYVGVDTKFDTLNSCKK